MVPALRGSRVYRSFLASVVILRCDDRIEVTEKHPKNTEEPPQSKVSTTTHLVHKNFQSPARSMNAQSFGTFRSVEFFLFRVAGHCRIRSSMRSCALPDELTIEEVAPLIEINHHVPS